MIITTKFDVSDLVSQKYKSGSHTNQIDAFEVMEVSAQKCYGGIQVFYYCKGLSLVYKRPFEFRSEKDETAVPVDINITNFNQVGSPAGWIKLREDELRACPESISNLIKQFNTEQSAQESATTNDK